MSTPFPSRAAEALRAGLRRWICGPPPISSVRSRENREHLLEEIELFPEQTIADSNELAVPQALEYRSPARTAFVLEDVRVWPSLGVAADRRGSLLEETAFSRSRLEKITDSRTLHLFHADPVDDLCTVIHAGPWLNYYHWLIDILPRIYGLHHPRFEAEPAIRLLCAGTLTRYQRGTLEAVLPANVHVTQVATTGGLLARRFISLPFLSGDCAGYLPRDYLSWFRRRLFDHLGLRPLSSRRHSGRHGDGARARIYISRRQAKTRRYTDEPALIETLRGLGLQAYVLEEMPFADQVELFSRSSIVVARHGAGLTNLLFSPPCRVLELHVGRVLNHYRLLCTAGGHRYANLLDSRGDKNADVAAPTADIVRMIARLEESES